MSERAAPRRWELWVVVLYLSSGLPFGIIDKLIPIWLKTEGVSLTEIGLASLLGLPWVLKALWAPLVDRAGTVARWTGGALAVIALALGALGTLSPGPVAAALLLAIAFASATQDVAIDGYVAGALPERLHGRANGIRVAAYRAAMLGAGGGGIWLAAKLPWSNVFFGLAVVAAALGLLASRLDAPRRPVEPASAWLKTFGVWVARPGVLALVAFVLLFKLGDAAMGPMIGPFWIDAGLSLEAYGLFSTGLGTALTIGGALLGGELVTRYGLFRALWTLGAAQALSNLGYAAVALAPSTAGVYAASAAESLCGGLGTAAYLAFLMKATEGEQTATRFALLTALAGLTRTLAGAVSGAGAEHYGYAAYFALTFALALPAFGLLPWVRRRCGGEG